MVTRIAQFRLPGASLFLMTLSLFASCIFAQTDFEIQVERVVMTNHQPMDTTALVTLAYNPGENGMYVNLRARDTLTQVSCTVMTNMYLPPRSYSNNRQSISTTFSPSWYAATAALFPRHFDVNIYLSSLPQNYPLDSTTNAGTQQVCTTDLLDNAKGAVADEEKMTYQTKQPGGVTRGDIMTSLIYRGCSVPNLDLDDSTHAATATYAGDLNACVPTSTANSLLWMAQKYNLFNGSPPSPHDLVESLSKAMKRVNKAGTPTDNMIQGKLDFIQSNNLPITVEYQVKKSYINKNISSTDGKSSGTSKNTGAYATWEYLEEVMKKGCDVEINYVAEDEEGKLYAHSIVVTGMFTFQKFDLKYLFFKHDRDQSRPGGTKQEAVRVWTDPDGKLRIGGLKSGYIRDVVAECPIEKNGIIQEKSNPPEDFRLLQNYPNPFNPSTAIRFGIGEPSEVTLEVLNLRGETVATLVHGSLDPGLHTRFWNAVAPSGVYLLRLRAEPSDRSKNPVTLTRKITRLN